jgi:hypothetical protein
MKWDSFRDLKAESVSQSVAQYGAVHSIWDIGPLGAFIHKDDYLSNFLLPLWLQLRNIYAKKKQFGKELVQNGWLREPNARPVSGHSDLDVTRDQ